MALLTFSTTLSMFILVAVIWGAGNTFLYPSLVAYALDRAGASRGPAMGTFTAVSDLGSGIGPVITGTILQLTSYRIMFSALVLVGILNLLYFLFFVRKR
jgi:MFS family permease